MGKEKKTEDSLKKAVRVAKVNKLIEAIIMIVFGTVLVIWSGTAMYVIFRAVAAVVAVAGLAIVIGFMFGRSNVYGSSAGLFGGVIAAVLGIYLFMNPDILVELGPTIVGLIIIITGIVDVTEAMRIDRQGTGGTTAAIIIGVVELILGVIFVLHPTAINSILFILMGLALIADGITDIWLMFQIGRTVKEVADDIAAAQSAVDGEATVVEEEEPKGAAQSFVERAKARSAARKETRDARKAAESAKAGEKAAPEAAEEAAAGDGYTTIPHRGDTEIPSANDIAEEIPPQ